MSRSLAPDSSGGLESSGDSQATAFRAWKVEGRPSAEAVPGLCSTLAFVERQG